MGHILQFYSIEELCNKPAEPLSTELFFPGTMVVRLYLLMPPRDTVVSSCVRDVRLSVFCLLMLYLRCWFCLPCVRCLAFPALPCVRFVCSVGLSYYLQRT